MEMEINNEEILTALEGGSTDILFRLFGDKHISLHFLSVGTATIVNRTLNVCSHAQSRATG